MRPLTAALDYVSGKRITRPSLATSNGLIINGAALGTSEDVSEDIFTFHCWMAADCAASFKAVIVDTTVAPKAVAHPTDSRLLERSREHLVKAAARHGLKLRQFKQNEKIAKHIAITSAPSLT